MAVFVSDPRFWKELRKTIEERRDKLVSDIKKGLEQTTYLRASGEIQGYEYVLDRAKSIAAKLGETEDS